MSTQVVTLRLDYVKVLSHPGHCSLSSIWDGENLLDEVERLHDLQSSCAKINPSPRTKLELCELRELMVGHTASSPYTRIHGLNI